MKLIVLNWFKSFLLSVLAKSIEIFFRVLLFLLPLGVYLLLLQYRRNVSKVSNLSVYTNDHSIWQHVFPGFILVSIDPKQFKNKLISIRDSFQKQINTNKYLLAFLFMLAIILIMLLCG